MSLPSRSSRGCWPGGPRQQYLALATVALTALGSVVQTAFVTPFSAAVSSLRYLDQRMRKGGVRRQADGAGRHLVRPATARPPRPTRARGLLERELVRPEYHPVTTSSGRCSTGSTGSSAGPSTPRQARPAPAFAAMVAFLLLARSGSAGCSAAPVVPLARSSSADREADEVLTRWDLRPPRRAGAGRRPPRTRSSRASGRWRSARSNTAGWTTCSARPPCEVALAVGTAHPAPAAGSTDGSGLRRGAVRRPPGDPRPGDRGPRAGRRAGGPVVTGWVRRHRATLVVLVGLVVAVVVVALSTRGSATGTARPGPNPDPAGAQAVARVLADQGSTSRSSATPTPSTAPGGRRHHGRRHVDRAAPGAARSTSSAHTAGHGWCSSSPGRARPALGVDAAPSAVSMTGARPADCADPTYDGLEVLVDRAVDLHPVDGEAASAACSPSHPGVVLLGAGDASNDQVLRADDAAPSRCGCWAAATAWSGTSRAWTTSSPATASNLTTCCRTGCDPRCCCSRRGRAGADGLAGPPAGPAGRRAAAGGRQGGRDDAQPGRLYRRAGDRALAAAALRRGRQRTADRLALGTRVDPPTWCGARPPHRTLPRRGRRADQPRPHRRPTGTQSPWPADWPSSLRYADHDRISSGDARERLAAIRAEVAKAVVGQDRRCPAARRAAVRWPRCCWRGARGRQDAARPGPWPRPWRSTPDGCSSPRPDAGRHHRLDGDRQPPGELSFREGRSSPTSCSATRSADAAQDPSRRCWRPWRRVRCPSTASRGRSPALPGRGPQPTSVRGPARCRRPSWTASC